MEDIFVMACISKTRKIRIVSFILSVLMIFTSLAGGIALATEGRGAPLQDVPESAIDEAVLAAEVEVILAQSAAAMPADAIYIENESDLGRFLEGYGPSDGHYILTADLNMDSTLHAGRGLGVDDERIFTGTFDGGNHSITGLRIRPRHGADIRTDNALEDNNAGFIRVAGNGAIVRNVTLTGLGDATEDSLAFLDNTPGAGRGSWNDAQTRSGLIIGRVQTGTVAVQNVHIGGHTLMRMNRASTNNNDAIGGFVGGVETGAIHSQPWG